MITVYITKEEQKAIAALKRLAKKWPQSLELFSWSGSLVVSKLIEEKRTIVDHVPNIPNDGGDSTIGVEFHHDNDYEIIWE